jgi:acetylornithine deacetylase
MSAATGFDPVAFLERAVATPSHESVDAARELLVRTLAEAGVDLDAGPRIDDAGNVLAARGSGSPHVVLNSHLDTVAPPVPFERTTDDEGPVIRGRGACDAKGPLAALVAAFLAVEPRGRLTLAVTPDEERRSRGAAALDLDADAYVVGEPTGRDVCHAARGRFEATLSLAGTNAHAAEPAAGANAVAALAPALRAVRTFDAERGPGPHDALGAPTLTPTVVAGGETTNQVPADAALTLDRRSVPPETAAGFRDALAAHVAPALPDGVTGTVALTDRETPFLEAFATDPAAPLVRALAGAARATGDDGGDGGAGAVRPFGAATEASYFAPAPTVVFGPGVLADDEGPVAHADREYVRPASVRLAARALRTALDDPATWAALDG